MKCGYFLLIFLLSTVGGYFPPKFQWKTIDYAWRRPEDKKTAEALGDYVPTSNLPTGLARWRDKLFITIPRWKKGVPSSLNYIDINCNSSEPLLNPYPNWDEAYVSDSDPKLVSKATVVSTFRIHIDHVDRLWVVDNGVVDIANSAVRVAPPAVVLFDLRANSLLGRHPLPQEVLRDDSTFTSIVVDIPDKSPNEAYAYITDMGSNALVVFRLRTKEFWRIEHPYFNFDPKAGVYYVGGVEFHWSDGVSSAALTKSGVDGHRRLLLNPTSSTKQLSISTRFLRCKDVAKELIQKAVQVIGDRGPRSQVTACAFDPNNNVLFFTLMSKNGVGCWNLDKPFSEETVPLIISDCNLLEFPNDVKVDRNGELWILSDRQSRFIYNNMDFNRVNFRIFTAPVGKVIQGTPCEVDNKNSIHKLRKKIFNK